MQTNKRDTCQQIEALNAAAEQALLPWAPLPDGKKWCVALSGGADSTALLHILKQLADKAHATLCGVIVNHNLRQEAKAEAEAVQQAARDAQIEVDILTITEQAPSSAIQEWARQVRYDALCRYARQKGCLLLFAHHLDDQNETIAMRLSHGSSLRGLCGMKQTSYRQGVPIIRPFLNVPKQQLYDYCHEKALFFIEDPSNQKTYFERVRWRHILNHDEVLRQNIHQLGTLAARLQRQVDETLAPYFKALSLYEGLWAEMDFDVFCAMPEGAKQPFLRSLLALIGGRDYVPSLAAQKQAVGQINAGHTITLGHVIIKNAGTILQFLPEAGRPKAPEQIKAGTDMIFEGRFLVRTAQDGLISRLDDDIWGALAKTHPLRQQLNHTPAAVRRTFPVLHALDEEVMTTHINGMTQIGHFTPMGWPSEGVDIYPLGRLARGGDHEFGLA